MHILVVASESSAFVKAGGLGDVVHSLSKALTNLGHKVWVIVPKYASVREKLEKLGEGKVYFDYSNRAFSILRAIKDGVEYYFVDYPPYYKRPHIYAPPKGSYEDNHLRFAFLSLASLEILRVLNLKVDIIHIHDWHTSLLPIYRNLYFPEFSNIPVVLTIHNAMHQGLFDPHVLPPLNIPWEFFRPFGGIEFYGKVNFLKTGITFCDVLTTVSPTYAEELKNYAFGLEGLIKEKKYFFGILNGIDYDVWNPEKDPYIRENYTYKDFHRKKPRNKRELKEIFGFNTFDQKPLVGMVARLTYQKGFDLLEGIINEAVREGFDFIMLGSGEDRYQEMLINFMKAYPEGVRVRIEYNEELAHKVFAGSDIFLMPSLYEPCGIAQMIAMRYGTVPVVRAVGGLKDTVIDYIKDPDEGTGFVFDDFSSKDLLHALLRARVFYGMYDCFNDQRWADIVRRCMIKDFSWEKSAKEYERIYHTARVIRSYDS